MEDIGTPVTVFGMEVAHGDLIHADRHGAVVIALEYLQALPACIDLMQRKEAPLLAAARSVSFTLAMVASDDLHWRGLTGQSGITADRSHREGMRS
nr:hypothetical protein [Pantoea sp. 18069]